MTEILLTLYQTYGFPLGVIITLLIGSYFIRNPEKFEKWASIISWGVSNFWKGAEYIATKQEIQGKINTFVGSLEANTTAKFPRVALRWVNGGNDEVVWEEDQAIILMRDKNHKVKNFVHAAYFFTSEALLRKSKRHLSKTQKKSLDLFATKQILESTHKSAVEQFMTDYFVPHIENNEDVRKFVKQYVNIEQLGVFFPILIQELSYLGHKVFLEKPSKEIIEEVKNLTKFLEDFSQREVGDQNVSDEFVGRYTRCAIRVIASRPVREKGDITSHKERVKSAIENKYENIYLVGTDNRKNRSFMNRVTDAIMLEFTDLQKLKTYRFGAEIKIRGKITPVKTYFVHLHNPEAVKHIYKASDTSTFDLAEVKY